MKDSPDIHRLITAKEFGTLLEHLGEAIDSCCAVVRYPNEEERTALDSFAQYLRRDSPETPSEELLAQMHQRLASLSRASASIAYRRCSFCDSLCRSRLADLRCLYCNYVNAKLAFETRVTKPYRCHAGLFDMVAPIAVGVVAQGLRSRKTAKKSQ